MKQPLGLSDFFKIVFESFVIIPFVLLEEWSFPRNNAQSTIQLRKWKLCKHFLDRVNFKVSQSHGLWSHALNCKTHTCFKLQFKRSNAGISLWNRKTTVRLKLWFRYEIQELWNVQRVRRSISQNKLIFKLLVSLFAFNQHQSKIRLLKYLLHITQFYVFHCML